MPQPHHLEARARRLPDRAAGAALLPGAGRRGEAGALPPAAREAGGEPLRAHPRPGPAHADGGARARAAATPRLLGAGPRGARRLRPPSRRGGHRQVAADPGAAGAGLLGRSHSSEVPVLDPVQHQRLLSHHRAAPAPAAARSRGQPAGESAQGGRAHAGGRPASGARVLPGQPPLAARHRGVSPPAPHARAVEGEDPGGPHGAAAADDRGAPRLRRRRGSALGRSLDAGAARLPVEAARRRRGSVCS